MQRLSLLECKVRATCCREDARNDATRTLDSVRAQSSDRTVRLGCGCAHHGAFGGGGDHKDSQGTIGRLSDSVDAVNHADIEDDPGEGQGHVRRASWPHFEVIGARRDCQEAAGIRESQLWNQHVAFGYGDVDRRGIRGSVHRVDAGITFRADVERILKIKAWQTERLSLETIRQRLNQLDHLPQPAVLVEEFLSLATAGDLAGARRVVLGADDIGMPLEQLFDTILVPVLYEIGRRWQQGDLLIAQEKELSELARDLIATLTARHADPEPRGPVAVAACVEGEDHDLGLRMVCGLLREKGVRLHLLGADVAPRFLLEAVRLHKPPRVLLSAHLDQYLPALVTATQVLLLELPSNFQPTVVAGGASRIVTLKPFKLRAVAVTNDGLGEAVEVILRLLPLDTSG